MTGSRSMRRALLLAYHFPPLGGAGVQRAVQLASRLPAHGFRPVVITGPLRAGQAWPPPDASLAGLLGPDLEIHRLADRWAHELEPKRRTRLEALRVRMLRRPAAFDEAWVAGCVETGLRAAREHAVDVVLATLSPFASTRAAEELGRELGVPWVADLRDPWALDEMMIYPTRWHRRAELRRMGRALSGASAVVMNTPEATRALREAFPEIPAERVATIPNGFDADDFSGPPPPRESERFRIVHTGHLHTALALRHRRTRALRRLLGGERAPVDLSTRTHLVLLRALERWAAEEPDLAARMEVVLAGAPSAADRAAVERSSVAGLVGFTGYLEHDRSVELLRTGDLLFLPMQDLPPGVRARIVPGKTYEYLAARRPILAAVPAGDARDIVLASGLGHVCEPGDAGGMLRILKSCEAAFRAGHEPKPPDDEFYRRFERATQARQMAEVFDRVCTAEVRHG